MYRLCLFFLLLSPGTILQSQIRYPNPIRSSVEYGIGFLDFCTDPSAGATGEAAVVADQNYQHAGLLQNPALLTRNQDHLGFNMSYTPWMRLLSPGLNIFDLNSFYSISPKRTLGYRFRYFSMANFTPTVSTPGFLFVDAYEYLHQLSYAEKFMKSLSAGISFKYFQSNLGEFDLLNGYQYKPINSFAFDLGLNYEKNIAVSKTKDILLQIGSSIRNFGPKTKYSDDPEEKSQFLPTIFGLGMLVNEDFRISEKSFLVANLVYQTEKYLVPSIPVYDEGKIIKGMDPDISIFKALYRSWYDDPDGLNGEMHEFIHKVGGELRLSNYRNNYLALRLGKIMQHYSESNSYYNTFGAGIFLNGFSFDFKLFFAPGNHPIETWVVSAGYKAVLER